MRASLTPGGRGGGRRRPGRIWGSFGHEGVPGEGRAQLPGPPARWKLPAGREGRSEHRVVPLIQMTLVRVGTASPHLRLPSLPSLPSAARVQSVAWMDKWGRPPVSSARPDWLGGCSGLGVSSRVRGAAASLGVDCVAGRTLIPESSGTFPPPLTHVFSSLFLSGEGPSCTGTKGKPDEARGGCV